MRRHEGPEGKLERVWRRRERTHTIIRKGNDRKVEVEVRDLIVT